LAIIRALEAGTVRHDRRGRVAIGANLTVSFHPRNGPLTAPLYRCSHGDEEHLLVRLIVTLTAALTVLFLVLPAHP
jgi:hypothetical protein